MPDSGVIHNPSDRMIPWDTQLTADKIPLLRKSIAWRRRKLSRARMDPETSLWLMDELEHLRKMLKFNLELIADPSKGAACACS